MKKMLAGFIMDGKSGGIDRYLLNFIETVHEQTRVDLLTNEIDPDLEKQLEKYHTRLFAIANLKHPLSQYRQVRKILREGGYDAVYLNISTAIDCIAAIASKHEKIPVRILHSHSSGNDCESGLKRNLFNFIHKICRCFLYRYATKYCGCSVRAGEWMFPEKIVHSDRFEVIFNAVDREKYGYDETVRRKARKELGLDGHFVVGHAGNFCYQKNHFFLLDIFEEIHKKRTDAVLLLAGDGVRFEAVKEKVREKGLEDSVRMLGRRPDVGRLYQAMDVFVLPSNFEGLPIAGIEAQSAGLPCFMSSRITEESRITENCRFFPLEAGAEEWAQEILGVRGERKAAVFLKNADDYDLASQKRQLLSLAENI